MPKKSVAEEALIRRIVLAVFREAYRRGSIQAKISEDGTEDFNDDGEYKELKRTKHLTKRLHEAYRIPHAK